MTEQATDLTLEDTTGDDANDATTAERLAALEAENTALRGQVEVLTAVRDDAGTRDERLAQAEAVNAALREQAGAAILDAGLRSAAETLDLDPGLVAGIYGHHFEAVPAENGAFKIEPNPTEFLAQKARTDPLLKRSSAAGQQSRASRNVMTCVASGDVGSLTNEQVTALVDGLDRNSTHKVDFIKKHGANVYIGLTNRARRIKKRAGETRQGGIPTLRGVAS